MTDEPTIPITGAGHPTPEEDEALVRLRESPEDMVLMEPFPTYQQLHEENAAMWKQLAECRRDWAGTLSTLANSFGRSGWPSDKGVAEKLLRKAAELRRMAEEKPEETPDAG